MTDEAKEALSGVEEQHIAQQQAVEQAEASTGAAPVARTATHEPETLDPRFDRDDLRQGKPPPALKKHRLRLRRHRASKGKPLSTEERKRAKTGAADEAGADMTDEEVDLTDDDEGGKGEQAGEEKKPGIIGKILGKDKT